MPIISSLSNPLPSVTGDYEEGEDNKDLEDSDNDNIEVELSANKDEDDVDNDD